MFNIVELIFLILVLFGLQRYLASRDNKLLGLVIPVIFNLYVIYNFKFVHQDIEYLWYRAIIGNLILLVDYYFGFQRKKESFVCQNKLDNFSSSMKLINTSNGVL
ncbi:hypothetical protein EGM85_05570 [Macrococcus caseolyticus]|nr:hypothetical protein [Macrococcus caseolyticus]RKO15198.1 hypothetical protein D6861_05570 [Macrococcus caseolyticus]